MPKHIFTNIFEINSFLLICTVKIFFFLGLFIINYKLSILYMSHNLSIILLSIYQSINLPIFLRFCGTGQQPTRPSPRSPRRRQIKLPSFYNSKASARSTEETDILANVSKSLFYFYYKPLFLLI